MEDIVGQFNQEASLSLSFSLFFVDQLVFGPILRGTVGETRHVGTRDHTVHLSCISSCTLVVFAPGTVPSLPPPSRLPEMLTPQTRKALALCRKPATITKQDQHL